VRNERVRYLSPKEHDALLKELKEAPEPWLLPAVMLALDTGLRQSNICNLMWSEIDFSRRMILLSADKMKNADYLGVPLTNRLLAMLRSMQDQKVRAFADCVFHDGGERLYPVKLRRAFHRVLRKARIENFRWHDLRHCFCSYLRQRGVDLHTIAALAGHRDLRMTKRYAHLNVDNLRDAVSQLESATILQQSEKSRALEAV
jgi:integrase